jgi:quercetin dioxygenase-like cupin family protein
VADEPIIARAGEPFEAAGRVVTIAEWRGSGPPQLHVHDEDDEAWHVLDGTIEFHFAHDRRETVGPGATVFVPAGVAHTYVAADDARYLIVLTRRLAALIEALHSAPAADHPDVYRRYASRLVSSE